MLVPNPEAHCRFFGTDGLIRRTLSPGKETEETFYRVRLGLRNSWSLDMRQESSVMAERARVSELGGNAVGSARPA